MTTTLIRLIESHTSEPSLAKIQECFQQNPLLDIDALDAKGCTALILAARKGFFQTAKELLRQGANVNGGRGVSALTDALAYEDEDHDIEAIVRLLLAQNGINVNFLTQSQQASALHLRTRFPWVTSLLLQKNVDIYQEATVKGESLTAREIAECNCLYHLDPKLAEGAKVTRDMLTFAEKIDEEIIKCEVKFAKEAKASQEDKHHAVTTMTALADTHVNQLMPRQRNAIGVYLLNDNQYEKGIAYLESANEAGHYSAPRLLGRFYLAEDKNALKGIAYADQFRLYDKELHTRLDTLATDAKASPQVVFAANMAVGLIHLRHTKSTDMSKTYFTQAKASFASLKESIPASATCFFQAMDHFFGNPPPSNIIQQVIDPLYHTVKAIDEAKAVDLSSKQFSIAALDTLTRLSKQKEQPVIQVAAHTALRQLYLSRIHKKEDTVTREERLAVSEYRAMVREATDVKDFQSKLDFSEGLRFLYGWGSQPFYSKALPLLSKPYSSPAFAIEAKRQAALGKFNYAMSKKEDLVPAIHAFADAYHFAKQQASPEQRSQLLESLRTLPIAKENKAYAILKTTVNQCELNEADERVMEANDARIKKDYPSECNALQAAISLYEPLTPFDDALSKINFKLTRTHYQLGRALLDKEAKSLALASCDEKKKITTEARQHLTHAASSGSLDAQLDLAYLHTEMAENDDDLEKALSECSLQDRPMTQWMPGNSRAFLWKESLEKIANNHYVPYRIYQHARFNLARLYNTQLIKKADTLFTDLANENFVPAVIHQAATYRSRNNLGRAIWFATKCWLMSKLGYIRDNAYQNELQLAVLFLQQFQEKNPNAELRLRSLAHACYELMNRWHMRMDNFNIPANLNPDTILLCYFSEAAPTINKKLRQAMSHGGLSSSMQSQLLANSAEEMKLVNTLCQRPGPQLMPTPSSHLQKSTQPPSYTSLDQSSHAYMHSVMPAVTLPSAPTEEIQPGLPPRVTRI